MAKAALEEELLAPSFRKRTSVDPSSKEATISSRVWKGAGHLRRARLVLVNGGPKVEAFNVVVYPSYHRGPRPVLGVDVLSFSGGSRLLFGVDWAPMWKGSQYAEAYIAPYLSSLLEDYDALRTPPNGKIYGSDPEFFSPYMFFSRPEDPEALRPGSALWNVSMQYFERCPPYPPIGGVRTGHVEGGRGRYLQMLEHETPLDPELRRIQAEERQTAYDIWHAERDPALILFQKIFGRQWTEDFSRQILFPGSATTQAAKSIATSG